MKKELLNKKKESMKKAVKRTLNILSVLATILVAGGLWFYFSFLESNSKSYATIGDIPTPWGYERIDGHDPAYTQFLRSLPLKEKGTPVYNYTGEESDHQILSFAVVDMPLLSNAEQCADVCMRLRSEYLFSTGQYDKIHFQNVNGKTMQYRGGSSHKSLERYLRNVYAQSSTFSLDRELESRPFGEVQPGDVFVYPANEHKKVGHAIMVADVARNPLNGKRAMLLVEGNLPARDIHVLNSYINPFRSPWVIIDEDDKDVMLAVFHYKEGQLRHF